MAPPFNRPPWPNALRDESPCCKLAGGPEFKGSFARQARAYCDRHRIARPYKKNEQAYIESFNRTLWKECLGCGTYRVEDSRA